MTPKAVQQQIAKTAQSCNRSADEITLVAVTKGHSVEEIQHLYDAGLRDFGENRVQEALAKITQLPKDIRWHFIGKLQKNKVSKVISQFALIHSVDRVELAEKIAQTSLERGVTTAILLEANTSGEATKSGLDPEEWKAAFAQLQQLDGIEIRGCMTMAPFVEDQKIIRETFERLRHLCDALGLRELSMGMSHDFPIAIEEGATLLRVGSALFE